jgi:hypothetical protein
LILGEFLDVLNFPPYRRSDCAPSIQTGAIALALPIPEPAPVTNATLLFSCM